MRKHTARTKTLSARWSWHPLAAAELHAQLQQRAFEEEQPLRGDDPIFLLENEHSLYNYWQFYQRSNGIDPPVSLYELRHTFVSIIEDAVSPAELRRMVGHSKSMDTYGWYSHAVDGRADTASNGPFQMLWQSILRVRNNPLCNPFLFLNGCDSR